MLARKSCRRETIENGTFCFSSYLRILRSRKKGADKGKIKNRYLRSSFFARTREIAVLQGAWENICVALKKGYAVVSRF
jgi:hypothetical protein